ncbi:MAG: hypothetical protein ACFE9D_04240 [Promethearchaeota archaeon]
MANIILLTVNYRAINGQRKRGLLATPTLYTKQDESETDSAFNGIDLHR